MDYLSHATIIGFLAAVAIGIVLQQLKALFGITNFTNKTDLISVIKSLWTSYINQVRKTKTFIIEFDLIFVSLTFFSLTFFSQNGILTILSLDSHFCLSSYLLDSWLVNSLEN